NAVLSAQGIGTDTVTVEVNDKNGDASTCQSGDEITETFTVISSPLWQVEASPFLSFTSTVTVSVPIPWALRTALAELVMSEFDLPGRIPVRQPRRAALVSWC